MVTHLTTDPPVEDLTYGDQTGSIELLRLWSYVSVFAIVATYVLQNNTDTPRIWTPGLFLIESYQPNN
jgi:hypothetical protein